MKEENKEKKQMEAAQAMLTKTQSGKIVDIGYGKL